VSDDLKDDFRYSVTPLVAVFTFIANEMKRRNDLEEAQMTYPQDPDEAFLEYKRLQDGV
jgi:hypothetical protein